MAIDHPIHSLSAESMIGGGGKYESEMGPSLISGGEGAEGPHRVFFPLTLYYPPSTGPEVIKLFSYSTQPSTKFILLINVKMPTIVGILTFISRINMVAFQHV